MNAQEMRKLMEAINEAEIQYVAIFDPDGGEMMYLTTMDLADKVIEAIDAIEEAGEDIGIFEMAGVKTAEVDFGDSYDEALIKTVQSDIGIPLDILKVEGEVLDQFKRAGATVITNEHLNKVFDMLDIDEDDDGFEW